MSALTKKRLETLYETSDIVPYDDSSSFIIMSDCHRGQGNAGDNFMPNQNIYFAALRYYYEHQFTYIELGDGDELWENRRIEPVIQVHSDVFWLLSRFYEENRFYMMYGNHDIIKKRPRFCRHYFHEFFNECECCHRPLFPQIKAGEGLILKHRSSCQKIFLVHGHQGDFINDTCWRLGRFLVRYVWRPLELIGFLDPTGAGRPHKKKKKIEEGLSSFAAGKKTVLIAGHTHRPSFSKPEEGFYFNDGSCVHPRCITGIEITKGQISLVKWSVKTDGENRLFVAREILEGPFPLSSYEGKA